MEERVMICERLRAARIETEPFLRLHDVAIAIGLAARDLADYETGRVTPSDREVGRLLEFYAAQRLRYLAEQLLPHRQHGETVHSALTRILAERKLRPPALPPTGKWDGRLGSGQWVPKKLYDEACAFRDEARAYGEDAARRYNDLLAEQRILRCAFCDAEYPPDTPPTQHAALTAHVMQCPSHPLRAEIDHLRADRDALIALYSSDPDPRVAMARERKARVVLEQLRQVKG